MDKVMRERLENILKRESEINEELLKPEVLSDRRSMAAFGKELSAMSKQVDTYREYLAQEAMNKDAAAMLAEETDAEIVEMAQMEFEETKETLEKLEAELKVLLIPRDPSDNFDAIVEIRGAAGGDEGNIFAGDLYRMYAKYAESLGYKTEVTESSEAESGGYTLISFVVKGDEAYRHFKFESGAHRVQRVPKTETQGRIHTSTATVLVLPDVEDAGFEIDPNDLDIDTMRASGAGGQHVNKTDSAVRIVHKPTGIAVKCQDGRSQHANRDQAMKIIYARVYEEHQRIEDEKRNASNKSKIGKGDRSEKIRTYNYPQNRVSDHRIGLTIQKLDQIVEGKLGDVIDALIAQEQLDLMAQNDA